MTLAATGGMASVFCGQRSLCSCVLRRVSLANKCLLLFGLAVVLIIVAALSVPWIRLNTLVDESELNSARQVVATWEASLRRSGAGATDTARSGLTHAGGPQPGERFAVDESVLVVVGREQLADVNLDADAKRAWEALAAEPSRREFSSVRWGPTVRSYVYAVPVREVASGPRAGANAAEELQTVIVLTRQSTKAARTVLVSTGFLLAAGLVALGLAVLVFYLITNRIILSPVRDLRETAEQVRSGRLDVRSDIHTGDEFEELAETFNDMLKNVQTSEQQLRTLNETLDDKLTELGERNASLADSARLKGEFLANVTHELRTPLNSIIGFAELLDEQATRDAETAGEGTPEATRVAKRKRYIDNINSAGRSLLELINGLLEMARVEAGKVQLNVTSVNVREACETMLAMMKPVADKRGVTMTLEVSGVDELGPISTDGRKLQQILFNLMSNAVKFTADAADAREARMAQMDPEAAESLTRQAIVILRAEHLPPRSAEGTDALDHVRISVLDTGPGIAPEDQARIFEKFTQLDGGLGRKHAGTGLGLSIVKELTTLLQGEVMVQSTLGQGSMFSVILPMKLDPARTNESVLELSLRGSLSGARA